MVMTTRNTRAAASLILGIVSIIVSLGLPLLIRIVGFTDPLAAISELVLGVLGVGTGLLAVILGHLGLRESMRALPLANGKNQATTGLILGYVSLGVFLAILMGFLFLFAFFHYVSII